MTWRHPVLGPILPLARRIQPQKVWKHFFNATERWEDLTPTAPARLYDEALARGCPPYHASGTHAPFSQSVRLLLESHHDRAYGPAYTAELSSRETRWGPKYADRGRWIARTPHAVVAIVHRNAEARVVTAYRPLPPMPDVEWSEDDFQWQADYVFEKETRMDAADLARDLARFTSAGVSTPRDVWWLALAVARARALAARDASLRGPLQAAEGLLQGAVGVAAQVSTAVDPSQLLDRLADGLKDERQEDAEHALSDIEDALMVLDVLGLHERVQEILPAATSLLAWLPAEFGALSSQAAARRTELGHEGPAARLWETVEECLIGARVRSGAPASRPTSTLVDALLPAPSLLDRVNAWVRQSASAARSALEVMLQGITLQQPIPVMGARPPDEAPWTLASPASRPAAWLRAFVVDAEYPGGYDVTAQFQVPGATFWQLERPGQEGYLVVVSASTPVSGVDLAALLSTAESRVEVDVAVRRFTRPS